MLRGVKVWAAALLVVCAGWLGEAGRAEAFCGFYVSGGTAELFNNATQVVLMREGMRTVLSMQNNYQGPPKDFAMVIPVPVVLQKEDVKTLPRELFAKVDQMDAPRLVEYWEQDPCYKPPVYKYKKFDGKGGVYPRPPVKMSPKEAPLVKIEAQFEVGEYEVVVLSALDSGALDGWLRQNKYNIPAGAEPVLRPYVEAGTKFFVAKVNAQKVTFKGGQAELSPLRFHYDTQDFSLPIRLGMLNANGPQDLIVHVLAQNQRYEVANYKNAFIPTNLKVDDPVKDRFGEFYGALFDATLKQNPGAVVTEYSWAANTCDPCPGPTLTQADLMTLGADVMKNQDAWGYTLTRLHARYTKETLGEDLVFRAAPPVIGGRGTPDAKGVFGEVGATPSGTNNFQGRYAILHRWAGKAKCQGPVWGRWGGPPGGGEQRPVAARDLAFVPRGKLKLSQMVAQPIPELGVKPE
jgi:hypothetical protein